MPTNLTPKIRKRKRPIIKEIPSDLLYYLRHGPLTWERPPGQASDLLGDVLFFWSHEETLQWLTECWARHEKLIREGLNGKEPFIIERIERERKTIEGIKNFNPGK